uniref:Uncharacterized protein LOC110222782 n=1 Tax=Phascolarctos cinereus TaxID=38626 RepID=A0A6P5M5Y0_PHACI|nr:uncharacterized protein LOC110222782 [Phascolarctos cinereus]
MVAYPKEVLNDDNDDVASIHPFGNDFEYGAQELFLDFPSKDLASPIQLSAYSIALPYPDVLLQSRLVFGVAYQWLPSASRPFNLTDESCLLGGSRGPSRLLISVYWLIDLWKRKVSPSAQRKKKETFPAADLTLGALPECYHSGSSDILLRFTDKTSAAAPWLCLEFHLDPWYSTAQDSSGAPPWLWDEVKIPQLELQSSPQSKDLSLFRQYSLIFFCMKHFLITSFQAFANDFSHKPPCI